MYIFGVKYIIHYFKQCIPADMQINERGKEAFFVNLHVM